MQRSLSRSFVLLASLLLGIELAIRVFFASSMEGRFDYGYHPTSGFKERADGRVDLIRTGGRRFREQSFQKAKPPGMYRIVVIGDSVARGSSVPSAYAGQLEQLLRKDGIQAESINMSVGGYGAARKNVVLRQALHYKPDLVILHVNISNEFEDEREFRRSEEFKGWHPKNWLMKSLLVRRLYEAKTEKVFWELLPTEVRQQRMVSDADAELLAQKSDKTMDRWRTQVQRLTGEAVTELQKSGVQPFLVGQAFFDKKAPAAEALDDKGIQNILKQPPLADIPQISMMQVMDGGDLPKLYSDGSHMRAPGHLKVAEAIRGELLRTGRLPAGKASPR